MDPWIVVASLVFLFGLSLASFFFGCVVAMKRMQKLMRGPKFYAALPDHVLREIRYRCGVEVDVRLAREANERQDER